jgi:PAS domain S-box-containing protein
MDLVAEYNPSTALILVSTRPSAHISLADEYQARDLIEAGDHPRLTLAIKREHQTLRLRRELADSEKDLAAERDRFQGLLEASRDAIAYLHEGMHIEANSAYRAMFGLTREGLDGLPVMDLIAADARPDFKKAMHLGLQGEQTAKAIPCHLPDGRKFSVDMEFSPSNCNGETCIRIIIRQPTETETGARNEQVAALIADALERDQLQLLYHPIVSLNGETRENYSVIVRMLDECGKQLFAGSLVEQARRTEQLAKIDRWVVRHAIQELSRQKSDHKINFHIQLSREGALDNSMLSWICDCLREFKAKGNSLYFQFDYALLREKPAALASFIDGLKKINCRIACNNVEQEADDRTLPLVQPSDIVRYAASVTTSLRDDPASREPLANLNAKFHKMGIKTAAEGVEDAETLELLWWMGVDQVQGRFLQKPLPCIYPHSER